MSSDSLSAETAEDIRETVSDAVDRDDLASMLDGADGSASVGRQLGARAGRELGATVGRELGGLVAVDVMEGKHPRAVLADVKRRVRDLLLELLRDFDADAFASRLTDIVGGAISGGSPTDAVDSLLPEDADEIDRESGESQETEETEESVETEESQESEEIEETEESEELSSDDRQGDDEDEAAETGEESIPGDVSSLSADDMRDLKEDTYRELLEVLSYRDLQSIAKEVGVKANLGEDEMTDRIVEEFSDPSGGEDGDGDADSDGS